MKDITDLKNRKKKERNTLTWKKLCLACMCWTYTYSMYTTRTRTRKLCTVERQLAIHAENVWAVFRVLRWLKTAAVLFCFCCFLGEGGFKARGKKNERLNRSSYLIDPRSLWMRSLESPLYYYANIFHQTNSSQKDVHINTCLHFVFGPVMEHLKLMKDSMFFIWRRPLMLL